MNLPQQIIDHYEDPYHRGYCEHATHQAEINNAACGDTLVVQFRVSDGVIEEAWFDGEGCQLSQATASLLVESIEGKSLPEIETISPDNLFSGIEIKLSDDQQACANVALEVARLAVESPLDEFGEGPTFTGPDLGDEC